MLRELVLLVSTAGLIAAFNMFGFIGVGIYCTMNPLIMNLFK